MEKACLDSRQDYVTRAGLFFMGRFTICCSAQLHMTQAMGFPPPLFQGYSRVSLETSLLGSFSYHSSEKFIGKEGLGWT